MSRRGARSPFAFGRALPRIACAAIASCGLALAPAPAHADQEPDAKAVEDARFYFTEGSAHFQTQRYTDALASFEQSFKLAPSPNTELMIARCLRELGRRVDAVASFDHAALEAKRRVALGESKYAPAADAATSEGAHVRSQLGTVKVHVAKASGASVSVDGRPIALGPAGDATFLHEPGSTTVVVRDASGAQQRQTISVLAGSSVQMDFAGDRPFAGPPPPFLKPPTSESHGNRWAVPAAIGAGALTLVGLGTFIGFGISSRTIYDDLAKRCGPSNCGPADQADADAGKRAQTIANVGLVVGAVGFVATTAFVVIAISSGGDSAGARGPLLHGRFDARGGAGL